jgi:hypothetical protein
MRLPWCVRLLIISSPQVSTSNLIKSLNPVVIDPEKPNQLGKWKGWKPEKSGRRVDPFPLRAGKAIMKFISIISRDLGK